MDKRLEIPNGNDYFGLSGEETAMSVEFKPAINAYLKKLVVSPVGNLQDLIKFNHKFSHLVSMKSIHNPFIFKFSKTDNV